MRAIRKSIVGIVIAIGVLILLILIPIGPENSSYCAVASAVISDEFRIPKTCLSRVGREDYIIENEALYLRKQTTRSALILTTFVDTPNWNTSRIKEFRNSHPELEHLFPDQSKVDGGMTWVSSETDNN